MCALGHEFIERQQTSAEIWEAFTSNAPHHLRLSSCNIIDLLPTLKGKLGLTGNSPLA